MLASRHQVPFLKSLVWLDLGLETRSSGPLPNILPTGPTQSLRNRQDMAQGHFLCGVQPVCILSFISLWLVPLPRVKNTRNTVFYLITPRRIVQSEQSPNMCPPPTLLIEISPDCYVWQRYQERDQPATPSYEWLVWYICRGCNGHHQGELTDQLIQSVRCYSINVFPSCFRFLCLIVYQLSWVI